MRFLNFLFSMSILYAAPSVAQETKVAILPTVHRLHEKNPNYSYADVQGIIERFQPDIFGMEIRPVVISTWTADRIEMCGNTIPGSRKFFKVAAISGMKVLTREGIRRSVATFAS